MHQIPGVQQGDHPTWLVRCPIHRDLLLEVQRGRAGGSGTGGGMIAGHDSDTTWSSRLGTHFVVVIVDVMAVA